MDVLEFMKAYREACRQEEATPPVCYSEKDIRAIYTDVLQDLNVDEDFDYPED